jgi:hypothetical protein
MLAERDPARLLVFCDEDGGGGWRRWT